MIRIRLGGRGILSRDTVADLYIALRHYSAGYRLRVQGLGCLV